MDTSRRASPSARRETAIAMLEQAVARGWPFGFSWESPFSGAPLAEDPAFRTLRGDPRFRRIDAMIRTNDDRERHEAAAGLRS